MLLFLFLPILVVVPPSFNSDAFLMYPMGGFSMRWYAEIANSEVWQRAMINSLIVSLSTPAGDGARHAGGDRPGANRLSGQGAAHRGADLADGGAGGDCRRGVYIVFAPLGLTGSYTGLIIAHAVLSMPSW